MQLTLIGYWSSNFAAGWPKAEDFVDTDWNPEERQGVVAWLEFWPRVRMFRGYSSRRLCGQRNGAASRLTEHSSGRMALLTMFETMASDFREQ